MRTLHTSTITTLLLLTGMFASPSRAKNQEAASEQHANPQALIAKLVGVAEADTGYSPYISGSSFAPLSGSYQPDTELFYPAKPAVRSEALRGLVRLGPDAVPDLLTHLADNGPTRLVVRHHHLGLGGFSINKEEKNDEHNTYTVKVGDLCYVALGQIVNRPYASVWYQPTALIFVFTPTRAPDTCKELQKEWQALTPERHRASLLKDCEGKGDIGPRVGAFVRLGYYYPDALEALALQFLARSWYSYSDSFDFVQRKLYKPSECSL